MALERVIGVPKRGIGESTINQLYKFANENKTCLEDSIIKLLELNKLKPKIKTSLSQLINLIHKWRVDSKNKKTF